MDIEAFEKNFFDAEKLQRIMVYGLKVQAVLKQLAF